MLDRFSQIKPKLLFSVNAVVYNGRPHDHSQKLRQVLDGKMERGLYTRWRERFSEEEKNGILMHFDNSFSK